MARISKEDWISRGLDVLSKEGYHAIRIDWLCSKFRITKGSFYHHFESLEDYERQLLKFWEKRTLQGLEDVISVSQSAESKLNSMIEWVFSFSGTLELSLRAWALHNKQVKKLLVTMETKRINMVTQMYAEIGLPKKEARELAELGHATWVGIQTCNIEGVINPSRCRQLINEMVRRFVKELLPGKPEIDKARRK